MNLIKNMTKKKHIFSYKYISDTSIILFVNAFYNHNALWLAGGVLILQLLKPISIGSGLYLV